MRRHKMSFPAFVLDNLETMNFSVSNSALRAISRQSGLRENNIGLVIRGYNNPTPRTYNAIAEFMNWQKWTA